ncbi:hypothetical protein NDU88_006118 [Pleurodeles waltl]|uniref:Uncharacterized protein n=1 Tax=Pleurodeles waltl TaxID=8319 RepID=A0AAV7NS55_PLEWA|nr:hypothetical protein NDU88_006118 [Pleurodeles waltl]
MLGSGTRSFRKTDNSGMTFIFITLGARCGYLTRRRCARCAGGSETSSFTRFAIRVPFKVTFAPGLVGVFPHVIAANQTVPWPHAWQNIPLIFAKSLLRSTGNRNGKQFLGEDSFSLYLSRLLFLNFSSNEQTEQLTLNCAPALK